MKKKGSNRIPDKGEIGIDFPDKFYHGSFGPKALFVAEAENDGLLIKLQSPADRRDVQVHLHNGLLSEILRSWAKSLKQQPSMSDLHKQNLLDALKQVEKAIH